MSNCTAAQALKRMNYWLGYCEKNSSKYVRYTEKEYFELDKGSGNWTHAGYISGINPGAWCAMQVGLSVYEACGNDISKAKNVLRVWPYTVVPQIWNAADDDHKYYGDYQRYNLGRGSSKTRYTPKKGDAIIFTDDLNTRSHVGMVYDVNDDYVYTIEGNSSDMCRKRSYLRTSKYIYGYVQLNYDAGGEEPDVGPTEQYGAVCLTDPVLHELSKGCAGNEVKTVQSILLARGYLGEDKKPIEIDGDFGKNTKAAVKTMQLYLGVTQDGVVGKETWTKMLKEFK